MGQIALPFDADPRSEDFVVTHCNSDAAQALKNWQLWPYESAVLMGPSKSGKTSMGRVFAKISGGVFVDDFSDMNDEEIFHCWNKAREAGQPILMTVSQNVGLKNTTLPDLLSRLHASQSIILGPPDNDMVLALFQKLGHQFGMPISQRMADYVALRCERSYDAVYRLAEALNQRALQRGKAAGLRDIRELLSNTGIEESNV